MGETVVEIPLTISGVRNTVVGMEVMGLAVVGAGRGDPVAMVRVSLAYILECFLLYVFCSTSCMDKNDPAREDAEAKPRRRDTKRRNDYRRSRWDNHSSPGQHMKMHKLQRL